MALRPPDGDRDRNLSCFFLTSSGGNPRGNPTVYKELSPRSVGVSFFSHITSGCEAGTSCGEYGNPGTEKRWREACKPSRGALLPVCLLTARLLSLNPAPPEAAVLSYPLALYCRMSPVVAIGTQVKDKLNLIFYKMVLWI